MAGSKTLPKVKEDTPEGLLRLTLLNQGNVVGYGLSFPDGFTKLDLIQCWASKVHTYTGDTLLNALEKAWDLYPGLDFERTCG